MARNAVVISSDAGQFPAALFLAKRLVDLDPPPDTEVVVFCDSQEAIARARAWASVNCDIRHIDLPFRMWGDGRVTGATYYRFFTPDLSGATGRVLYLDVDTYPEDRRIWSLFDVDLGVRAVAASRALEMAFTDSPATRKELSLTHCPDGKYLNAGVLLFDVERSAKLKLHDKFFRRARDRGYHDQQAINDVLRGQWRELHPTFNVTMLMYVANLAADMSPVITHFMGDTKPWHGEGDRGLPCRRSVVRFCIAADEKTRLAARHADHAHDHTCSS